MRIGNVNIPDDFFDKYWHIVERTAVEAFEGNEATVRAAIAELRKAPPGELLQMLNAGPLGTAADIRGVDEINSDQLAIFDELAVEEAWGPVELMSK